LENFRVADLLAEGSVEARAALFDLAKMKCSYVCNGLDVVGIIKICIGDWNGGHVVELDRLWIGGAGVGIGPAAIADVPAGVDVEMVEVGES